MTTPGISFNRTYVAGHELAYMQDAIGRDRISGGGYYTSRCQQLLTDTLGARALLTTSCTHALEMAALLLALEPEDEVIIPSFTFVSTANAFALRRAKMVFCDVRADTLNLDETLLEHLITLRTKAIVVVHYAGVACEMDAILEIARRHGVAVVEDNAHGLFGKYKGRWLGTMGCLATQSFHETKNITCGEGGALLINDERFQSRAEIIREKGTNRVKFLLGQVDKYSWVDIGSSYVISDLLAAYLFAQLENWKTIQAMRMKIWQRYHVELKAWADRNGARRPGVPESCEPAWHMYYLVLTSLPVRQRLIAHLSERGIQTVFHYLPLHLSAYGSQWGGKTGDCPVTESVSECLLRLPFYNGMTDDEQIRVVQAISDFQV